MAALEISRTFIFDDLNPEMFVGVSERRTDTIDLCARSAIIAEMRELYPETSQKEIEAMAINLGATAVRID